MTTTAEVLQKAFELHRAGRLDEAERLYREVLAAEPHNAQAWDLLGVAADKRGQHADALESIGRAIELDPRQAAFHMHRAAASAALGRVDQAITAYREALGVRPDLVEARFGLGNLYMAQGLAQEAQEAFEIVVRSRPDIAEAHHNLAGALIAQGQPERAEAELQTALRLKPTLAEGHLALANLRRNAGRLEEAIAGYREVLRLHPKSLDALNSLAVSLRAAGRLDEAADSARRAVEAGPTSADAHSNMGLILHEQKRLGEAIACYREALRLQPAMCAVHNALGAALESQGDHQGALQCYREAMRLFPQFAAAYSNLGGSLRQLGRTSEAVICYEEALRLDPKFAEAYNGLGAALHVFHRPDEALAAFRRAIELKPDYAEAHCNLGLLLGEQRQFVEALACFDRAEKSQPGIVLAHNDRAIVLLVTGNFSAGWPEYEWRWQIPGTPKRPSGPAWDGGPLRGRTILLYPEQGAGDMMQFIRYVPLVKVRGGRVLVGCPKRMIPILSSCPGIDQFYHENPPPPFDEHAALLSLPGIFHTDLNTIPADVPYLSAPPDLVDAWRERLPRDGLFRVGINWQGSRTYRWDFMRSLPLAEFAPLAEVEGVRLFSLQKGTGIEQLADAPFAVEDLGSRLDLGDAAFTETAAVIKNLDLVISSDTGLVHLAGALGAPVWLALSYIADWRWLLDRADSPWYPTARLFRQSTRGNWKEVFERMAEELRRLVAAAAAPRKEPPQHGA
jgi:tetratricopeptide (TPR) repeat protein